MYHENLSANFLVMMYGQNGFLVNRTQFRGSHYIDKTVKLVDSGESTYLKTAFRYGGQTLGLLDFHFFLNRVFRVPLSGRENLALVFKTDIIQDRYRKKFQDVLKEKCLDPCMAAVRISNDSSIVNVRASSLRLLPEVLNDSLKTNGFLAVRFRKEDSIKYMDYYIDLATLVSRMVEKSF